MCHSATLTKGWYWVRFEWGWEPAEWVPDVFYPMWLRTGCVVEFNEKVLEVGERLEHK